MNPQPNTPASLDDEDAARWRRLVNASEASFPVATIADDPENDARMIYGRKRLEQFIDGLDEISDQYALAAPPAGNEKVGVVTDAMVDAYLKSNKAYWRRPDKWRTGSPQEATRESLNAVLATRDQEPMGPVGPRTLELSIAELDEWLERSDGEPMLPSEGESLSLVLHELKRLRAAHPTKGFQ